MTDEELGHAINGRVVARMGLPTGTWGKELATEFGQAARTILAARPEVTQEAVDEYVRRLIIPRGSLDTTWKIARDIAWMTLSHFAPPARPRMLIEGMSVEEIEKHMCGIECARVAHRLATTPARQSEMMAPKGDLLTDIHAGLVALMSEVQATWRAEDYPSAVRSDAAQFRHACLHAMKAIGRISALIDHADHERLDEPEASGLRSELPKLLADLLRCAAKMAEKAPFHAVDLADAYIQRAEQLAARWGRPSATTPAPEVDADARAKAAAWTYWQSRRTACISQPDAEHLWRSFTHDEQDGWRAVAAREKGNG